MDKGNSDIHRKIPLKNYLWKQNKAGKEKEEEERQKERRRREPERRGE
jgi:hypothetical protein